MKSQKQIEILYADDDQANHYLLKLLLDEAGIQYQLKTAEDGVQALKLLTSSPDYKPDIIFLDINMPLKDGFDCLNEIRANHQFDNTLVAIYSVSGSSESVAKAFDLKANLYMRKFTNFDKERARFQRLFNLDWQRLFPQPPYDSFVLNGA